jgi:(R,R)-butanediol dehydrogenase/meso-butanediol dehydrogenase/diacetyl reductase
MKAVVFKGAGQPLAVEQRPDPTPEKGQLVLRIGRCGVCGTDISTTSGHGVTHPAGMVLGHEVSGEVVALGAGVSRFKIGDRVTAQAVMGCGSCPLCLAGEPYWCVGEKPKGGHGGFAEFCITNESAAVKLPTEVSLEDAALTEPLCCGLHGVARASASLGARVLVIGAGAIALGTIYWARRLGAGRIAVLSRSDRGQSLAVGMGADAFISGRDDVGARVNEALGGRPDVVYECSGAEGMIAESISLVRPRGAVVVLGACGVPDSFLPMAAMKQEVDIRFAVMYTRRDFEFCLDVMNAGNFTPCAIITEAVGFDAFPAEFEALRQRKFPGKLMLNPAV